MRPTADSSGPSPPIASWGRHPSLVMGALCAVVGLGTGLWVWRGATGEGYWVFAVAAPLAAFLSGSACWWVLRARSSRTGIAAGAVTGAVAALVGHWICWYGILVGAFVCHAVTGGCTGSLGDAPMNPLQSLAGASLYWAFSLVFVGWVTVPAGALAGALVGGWSREPPEPGP